MAKHNRSQYTLEDLWSITEWDAANGWGELNHDRLWAAIMQADIAKDVARHTSRMWSVELAKDASRKAARS